MEREDRILGLIGLCRKAGKLSLGFEKTRNSCKCGKAALVLVFGGVSAKTVKNTRYECGRAEVPMMRVNVTMEELKDRLGLAAGVVCVNDGGFAKGLLKIEEENKEERIL